MDDWKNRLVIKNMLPNYSMVGNHQEHRKLQESGATKRRQEEESYQYPGMAEGGYPSKSKRPCLEDVTLSMGVPRAHASAACTELQPPPMPMNPSSVAMGVTGHSLMLENNPMNGGNVMGTPYAVVQPTDMSLKGAPHLVPYCDKSNNNSSNMQAAVDQELQELLDELTKIQEPGSAELDLEKILGNKPEEPLLLDHPQASLAAPSKPTVQMPHLESLGPSKEFPPSCSQVPGIALPMPSSSAGVSYGLPPTSKQMMSPTTSGMQVKNPAQARPPVAMPQIPVPQWHHAHQLKVLAASKQGSATKQQQTPAPTWSGLPAPGVSPPYRPVPSPHPPPAFSSQSLLVSCMSSGTMQASSSALLPSMPYVPSPAISQQQSQFTQQSSILAHLVSSTIKHPQGHMLTALPTSTPGPSPPYRPEKLASPGLPQQSFTPQCSLVRSLPTSSNALGQQQQQQQQQQMANAMFKPMSTNASKAPFNMLMPQAMASGSHGVPEPLSFGNTKPLSHFMSEPGPSKMPPMPAPSRHASLLHYLQQPPSMPSSATASSTATATLQLQQHDPSTFLLQQVMQQPQRYQQRALGSEALPTLPRQTHVEKACKLGETRLPQVGLGRQASSCQALGSESYLPGSSFAHDLARVTSHNSSQAAPWGGWDPKAWRQLPAPLLPTCEALAREADIRSYGNDP
ncbi:mastermind-like domain-containing protein 1 [Sorex araneus]|uniref:mastermind-like domain-containing protein 1 n=1 Tax=Sorex araneus TaxID=42254 RepID=UPI0024336E12|nr:mastermind-like domain-containing protein 1 [Sorex araneus]XP_054977856.1 mastermind-like domain-containing protein 1 [Sorex araneus]